MLLGRTCTELESRLEEIDWTAHETPQKTPPFFGLPVILLSPSPIIHNIQNNKKQKMSQYFSNNENSLNTVTTVNVSNNFTVADNRSSILAWLSPLEPRLRHQDVRASRVGNIGEWLLQTKEFRSWYTGSEGGESNNAVLFCYGNPGVGKTFIR